MTAKINITTPSGKSLEGFPKQMPLKSNQIDNILHDVYWHDEIHGTLITPGDIITIEVL